MEDALILFETHVNTIHECSKAVIIGKSNRAYSHVETIVKYLLENHALESLKTFYESSNCFLDYMLPLI